MKIFPVIKIDATDNEDLCDLKVLKDARGRASNYLNPPDTSSLGHLIHGAMLTASDIKDGIEEFTVAREQYEKRITANSVFLPKDEGEAIVTLLGEAIETLNKWADRLTKAQNNQLWEKAEEPAVTGEGPKMIGHYPMEWASRGREPNSVCEVAIFEGRGEEAGKKVIILTEPENNPGMSVTNGVEKIATQVLRQNSLHHLDAVFVEHYPKSAMHPKGETWDLVTLTWDCQGNAYRSPEWKHANWETVAPMIGASSREEIEI